MPLFDSIVPRTLTGKQRLTENYGSDALAAGYAYAHTLSRSEGRHLRSRIRLLHELLAKFPSGQLLDAGCGPGVLVHTLIESPHHDYRITVIDRSSAMVRYCVDSSRESGGVRAAVGDLVSLPFADKTFDITLVTGALEYTDSRAAVREISRVTQDGGLVVLSMLNPVNPYRLTEWFLYWPMLRMFSATTKFLKIRTKRPHGANVTGIRAVTASRLRRSMRKAGIRPTDLLYFDLTPLVPPLDRIPVLHRWSERNSRRLAPTRGWLRWMATGYVIVGHRD